jgi:hypothetical protein
MNDKIGRNDPCPCGSGKKYKQCCMLKSTAGKPLKFRAKVLSQPKADLGPNLMDRTFGQAVSEAEKAPLPKPYKPT